MNFGKILPINQDKQSVNVSEGMGDSFGRFQTCLQPYMDS